MSHGAFHSSENTLNPPARKFHGSLEHTQTPTMKKLIQASGQDSASVLCFSTGPLKPDTLKISGPTFVSDVFEDSDIESSHYGDNLLCIQQPSPSPYWLFCLLLSCLALSLAGCPQCVGTVHLMHPLFHPCQMASSDSVGMVCPAKMEHRVSGEQKIIGLTDDGNEAHSHNVGENFCNMEYNDTLPSYTRGQDKTEEKPLKKPTTTPHSLIWLPSSFCIVMQYISSRRDTLFEWFPSTELCIENLLLHLFPYMYVSSNDQDHSSASDSKNKREHTVSHHQNASTRVHNNVGDISPPVFVSDQNLNQPENASEDCSKLGDESVVKTERQHCTTDLYSTLNNDPEFMASDNVCFSSISSDKNKPSGPQVNSGHPSSHQNEYSSDQTVVAAASVATIAMSSIIVCMVKNICSANREGGENPNAEQEGNHAQIELQIEDMDEPGDPTAYSSKKDFFSAAISVENDTCSSDIVHGKIRVSREGEDEELPNDSSPPGPNLTAHVVDTTLDPNEYVDSIPQQAIPKPEQHDNPIQPQEDPPPAEVVAPRQQCPPNLQRPPSFFSCVVLVRICRDTTNGPKCFVASGGPGSDNIPMVDTVPVPQPFP